MTIPIFIHLHCNFTLYVDQIECEKQLNIYFSYQCFSSPIQGNADLSAIWMIGQKMWQRDFPGIYEALKREWPDNMKPIMTTLLSMRNVVTYHIY